tara:strand:+ start:127 stop:300 length:174 start_codon:yes stop_codon:yes gene_type:complete
LRFYDDFETIAICILPLIAVGIVGHIDDRYREKKQKQLHELLRNKNAAWREQQKYKA